MNTTSVHDIPALQNSVLRRAPELVESLSESMERTRLELEAGIEAVLLAEPLEGEGLLFLQHIDERLVRAGVQIQDQSTFCSPARLLSQGDVLAFLALTGRDFQREVAVVEETRLELRTLRVDDELHIGIPRSEDKDFQRGVVSLLENVQIAFIVEEGGFVHMGEVPRYRVGEEDERGGCRVTELVNLVADLPEGGRFGDGVSATAAAGEGRCQQERDQDRKDEGSC